MSEEKQIRVCSKCSCEFEHYGQRSLFRKECKKKYDRDYHSKRAPEAKKIKQQKQLERSRLRRKFIYDFLLEHPCVDCGEKDPIVLEFDHIDQETKEYLVSEMVSYSESKILSEIAKCRILCANCHRRRTAVQLGWYNHI